MGQILHARAKEIRREIQNSKESLGVLAKRYVSYSIHQFQTMEIKPFDV